MGKIKKINIFLVLLILFGSFLTGITMFKSGLKYDFGYGFWGPNGHDAIWHLSLINQLKLQVPPQNPIFSGNLLSNYHWGFDFIAAIISKLFFIDTLDLYFRILPLIFAVLMGFLSYKLAFLITKNKLSSTLFVFLNYFAGSFGWIYTLLKNGTISGESLFWSMQSASFLLNPPYAFSLIILLFGLILWIKHLNSNNIFWPIIIGIIFGLLSAVKVYSGVLIGLSLAFYYLYNFLKSKKLFNFNFFICLSTALVSFLILLLLGVVKSSSLLELKPLWFAHSLIESVDKLYLPKVASYRYNLSQNLNLIKLPLFLFIEFGLILIFIIGNLGTRVFGIYQLAKNHSKKKLKSFDILISFFLFFSLIIPLFFVQKGTAWNTIQFLYYFLFFLNFYLAQFLSELWNKKVLKMRFLVIILFFITPLTSIGTLKDYFGFPPPASLPNTEIEALDFLKEQKYGNILTFPYDKYKKNNQSTPIPLYMYETTAYVSAFSQKPSYLEDEMNLDITGFDWTKRRQEVDKFFQSTDIFYARGFLLNNNIDYIYLTDHQTFKLAPNDLQIDLIFNNGQSQVYRVRK